MKVQLYYFFYAVLIFVANSSSAQKATAYKEFHGKKAQTTINVEDDLYVRFSLQKSLVELAKERSISSLDKIYGIISMSLGSMTVTTGPMVLANSGTSALKEFDLVFSVVLKQFQGVATQRKEEWTLKDDVLLNVLAQPSNTMSNWMKLIAGRAVAGQTNQAIVTLSLVSGVDSQTPTGETICSGTFKVKVGKDVLLPMYGTRMPAMYRPVPDEGILDDLHSKNIGEILWSKEPISKKGTDEELLKTTFVYLKDEVYGRAYLPKSIRNTGAGVGHGRICSYSMTYYIDDNLVGTEEVSLEGSVCQNKTSFPIVLFQNESEETVKGVLATKLANTLNDLEVGEYTVKALMGFNYKDGNNEKMLHLQIATSEFKIQVKE
jgi:hypothetical protein